ncbi:HAD family hydrolase [Pseudomonadota bacterium]
MEHFNHPQPLESLDQITLLTDLDNTIWPWLAFACKSYPAIAQEISDQTGVPLEKIKKGMRHHYTVAGTLEDAGLIAGLKEQGIFSGIKLDEEELIREAQQIFQDYRNEYLQLYKGIAEMLDIITKNRVRILGLTDAPPFHAKMRARKLGLERWIKTLFALKPIKDPVLSDTVLLREARGLYDTPFTVIPVDEEKPDTDLPKVLGISGEDPSDIRRYTENCVYVLGDSVPKDMMTAHQNGAHGILADWGKAPEEQIAPMREIAPESITAKNTPTKIKIQEVEMNPKIVKAATPQEVIKIMGLLK